MTISKVAFNHPNGQHCSSFWDDEGVQTILSGQFDDFTATVTVTSDAPARYFLFVGSFQYDEKRPDCVFPVCGIITLHANEGVDSIVAFKSLKICLESMMLEQAGELDENNVPFWLNFNLSGSVVTPSFSGHYEITNPDTNLVLGRGKCGLTWDGTISGLTKIYKKLLNDAEMPNLDIECVRFVSLSTTL